MEELLDTINSKILIMNTKGEIEFCNKCLLEDLQTTLSSLKNKKLDKFLIVGQKRILNWQQLLKEGYTQFLKIFININHQEKIYQGLLNKTKHNDKELYYIVLEDRQQVYNIEDLEKILDQLPFVIWLKDRAKKYRFVNQCFINKVSVLTNPLERSSILQQEDKDVWDEQFSQIIEEGEEELFITKEAVCYERCIEVNNKKRWYQFNFIPIKDNTDELQYILGMREEITLHKKMELQLDKNYYKEYMENKLYTQDVEMENEQIRCLYQMQGINGRLQEVLEEIGAEGSIIGIYNKDRNSLYCTYKEGMEFCEIELLDEIKLVSNLKGKMLNENNLWGVRVAHDYYKYIRTEERNRFKADDSNYLGCYPIELENDILGVLICSYSNTKGIDSNKEKQIFKILKQLALIIQNEILTKAVKCELEKREELEEELQSFAETASDLMVIVTVDGYIKKVSGAWESVLGWTSAELVGRHFNQFVYSEEIQYFEEENPYINNTNTVRGLIYRGLCKNKGYKWIEWSMRYVSNRQHYICTGRDISKEKEQEEARKVYEEALQVEKIKSEFFANMSHEFRTPLNIILATVQLLEKEIRQGHVSIEVDFNLEKCLSTVKQNTYRILRLANNIMELTSIDAGHYKMKLENLNIVNIIEETTLSVAEYIESRGITLIFDTDVEEVITACDAEKLERIVLNILSNAVKYTLRGGIISVNLSLRDENLIVKVKDTGVGIPKEKLSTIFNPFIQVESLLTRKCEGSGIGLALVKSLVEMHEGTIKAKSELNKGTEIIIEIPIKTIDEYSEMDLMEFEPRIEQTKMEFSDIYNLY